MQSLDNRLKEQLDRMEDAIIENRSDIQFIKGFLAGRKFAIKTVVSGGGLVGLIIGIMEVMKL
jgi:hypothetical protein